MKTIFDFNQTSFENFAKFYDKAPGKARKSTARLLSKFAFGTRNQALIEIKKSMNIRNERFVARNLRFKGAKPTNIDAQSSGAGSIETRGFTGWIENAKGSRDNRTRSQTLLSRGNNWNKKIKGPNRMKPGNNFIDVGDFKLPDGKQKMPAFFAKIKRKHKNKPFVIKRKYKTMPKGLYVYKRRKIQKLQDFNPKTKIIKKNPWLRRARRNFFANNSIEKLWEESIKDLFKTKRF